MMHDVPCVDAAILAFESTDIHLTDMTVYKITGLDWERRRRLRRKRQMRAFLQTYLLALLPL
jgi:hypothetical protein